MILMVKLGNMEIFSLKVFPVLGREEGGDRERLRLRYDLLIHMRKNTEHYLTTCGRASVSLREELTLSCSAQ